MVKHTLTVVKHKGYNIRVRSTTKAGAGPRGGRALITSEAAQSDRPTSKAASKLGRNARLLLAYALVNGTATAAVGALVNPYLRELGMSAPFVGMYFGVTAVVQGLAQLAGGVAADRWGRRRIWVAGKLVHAASYALLATGIRGPALMASAVMAGLSQISSGAYMAIAAEAVAGGSRATFYSVVQTITSVGGTVAPLAGGLIADRYGGAVGIAVSVPLFLVVAAILSRLEEHPRVRAVAAAAATGCATAEAGSPPSGIRAVRGTMAALVAAARSGPFPRTAFALLAYMLLNGFSNGLINISLPLLLRDRLGMGYTGLGGLVTVSALGTALMMITGGRLADKYGRRRVMLFTCVWVTVLFVLIPLASSALHFYVLVFVICLVGNAAGGAFSATTMECVKPGDRATFGGLTSALASAGVAGGSFLGGLLYQAGQTLPFYLVIAVTAAGTAVLFRFLDETGTTDRGRSHSQTAAGVPPARREVAAGEQ